MHGSMLAIVLGLAAAVCFGVGDFIAQRVTKQHGWLSTLIWVQLASVPPLLVFAFAERSDPALSSELPTLVGLALLSTAGFIGLFRAFDAGALSVVSPVAGSFAAVTVVLAFAFGKPVGLEILAGLVMTIVGIVLASVVSAQGERRVGRGRGVGWALLASLGFGSVFYFLDDVVAQLGPAWPVVGLRVFSIPVLLIVLRVSGQRLVRPTGAWQRIATIAVLDTGGLVIYGAGTGSGHVAVVAVLASLFSAITVVLAQVRLRERLAPWQWLGVALLLAGVAWVTYFGR